MRVLDASVVVDSLVGTGQHGATARRVLAREGQLHVPGILMAEVTAAFRAMVLRSVLSPAAAEGALDLGLRTRRQEYPFEPFARRAWQLRHSVTTYDAWYVALAEVLAVPLVTSDSRLRGASGPRCPVISPEEALAP